MEAFSKISFMADELIVLFCSGKKLILPLDDFPELLAANNQERKRYEIGNNGTTVRWDLLDFELTIDKITGNTLSSTQR